MGRCSTRFIFDMLCKNWFGEVNMEVRFEVFIYLFSVAKEKSVQKSNALSTKNSHPLSSRQK